jgi:hypothetical protein
MKTLRHLLPILALALLPLPALADLSGVYVSQFSPSDPQYQAGGAQPVFLIVVDRNGQAIGTVNASYDPPNTGVHVNVWSYASLPVSGSGSVTIVDSFGVCNVTAAVSTQGGVPNVPDVITVRTTASSNKSGVANPLGINCLDLYPLIIRDFHRAL